jgi:type VI secretion system secreted protein Hcp
MEYMVLQVGNEGYKDKGESTLKGYTGNIEILSYSWNISNPIQSSPSNTGRTTGRPNFGELVVTKKLDATSPLFAYSCASAEDLGDVKLVLLRQDQPAGADQATNLPYMIYTLTSSLVSSVSVGGAGDIPIETVTFNYAQLGWHYEPQKVELGDGSENKSIKGWDLSTNSPASVGDDAAGGGA